MREDHSLRAAKGQASIEYLGTLVVAALLVVALLAVAKPVDLVGVLERGACPLPGGPDCRSPALDDQARQVARREQLAEVDRYLDAPLDDFLSYRDAPDRDARLNWTTDGCSAPLVGNRGASFDFTEACLRHDFGYRNTKALGVFGQRKVQIDDRFLADMKDHCATRSVSLQPSCYRWAYTFYYAVRRFG